MAYESTKINVAKSQGKIRELIYSHAGTGVLIVSQRPREGFEAMVTIGDLPYHIRVMATCKDQTYDGRKHKRTSSELSKAFEQEEMRVWRVLYWHLKAMFEAADSGVIDLRDVILPYVVTRDGRTLSEHLVPRMQELQTTDTSRLLGAGNV
jgi:hypothetical protein